MGTIYFNLRWEERQYSLCELRNEWAITYEHDTFKLDLGGFATYVAVTEYDRKSMYLP